MRRVIACAFFLFASATASAQAPAAQRADRITVFLDCQTFGCDRAYFIEELPYVVWTQDRHDAEVHALITSLETGAGGTQYTITMIGQQRFAGTTDTITTSVEPNSTQDARRKELARVIKLGLVPYVLRTGIASRLTLGYEAPAGDSAGQGALRDPWNNWVYRVGANGDGETESRSTTYRVEGSARASRITEKWKSVLEGEYSYRGGSFEVDDSTTEKFALREAEFEAIAIRSLTDHWSLGASAAVSMTEFANQDLASTINLGAEYNFFPWKEATRRTFVAIGVISARYFDYAERTIYGRDSETRLVAVGKLAAESTQPWGSLFASLEHARYLHDINVFSLELDSFVEVRISRGLSVHFGVNAEKVKDQLYLPAGDATPAQILLRQRSLATAYRVGGFAGISFTFGSIYNTIVNPRFDAY